jgi:hypothetical protein
MILIELNQNQCEHYMNKSKGPIISVVTVIYYSLPFAVWNIAAANIRLNADVIFVHNICPLT